MLGEALAAELFPTGDAIGRTVRVGNPTPGSERRGEVIEARVVGVVDDVRNAPREDPLPAAYLPHARDPWGNIFLVARAERDPSGIIAPLRRAVSEVDTSIPVAGVQPLAERAREYTNREGVFTRIMLGFAGLAVVLSAIGIYGALSNLVTRRLRELGIRVALGARPADVRRLVLRRALSIVLPGLAFGVLGAYALGRLMRGLLFGVSPTEPPTLLAAAALLGIVALLAGWVPARTAGRVDPAELLNSE